MHKPIIISGLMTVGKTTLARWLVQSGIVNMYLEIDHFPDYVSGNPEAWRWSPDMNETAKKAREKIMIEAYKRCANITYDLIKQGLRVALAGFWTTEKGAGPFLAKFQDYEVIYLRNEKFDHRVRFAESRERWIERGHGVRGQTDTIFDKFFPLEWWNYMCDKELETVQSLRDKGRLISPEEYLKTIEIQAKYHKIREFPFKIWWHEP